MPMSDALRAMLSGAGDEQEQRPRISRIGEFAVLRDALAAFNTAHEFRVGMIVRQKRQCPTYEEHSDNGLSIVVELLAEPIVDTLASTVGSAYYRHRLDMVIGERLGDGRFQLFHVDSRRYEPAPEEDDS
jgi:hypothetical protein